jgi:alpha-L-rhamnosidase
MTHDVGIWISKYIQGTWSVPKQIVVAKHSVCWNPVLLQHPSGELFLFYRLGSNPRNVVALVKRSYDGGESWTDEELLPAGIFGPTKAKPIVDEEGNIICGSSVECGEPTDSLKTTACWIEVADASAKQWKKYGPITIPGREFGALEPCLFKDQEGRLALLCRDRAAKIGLQGWIWKATSTDNGSTWSELQPTSLPCPDSGIEAVDLGRGRLLVVYNHSHHHRFPLSVALSQDGGNTWASMMTLEEFSGEMPSALLSSDNRIHIVYAWAPLGSSQRCIKHAIVDLK